MTGCENDNLELLGPREMMEIDLKSFLKNGEILRHKDQEFLDFS